VKQVLQSRRGLVVVRDVPKPRCPPGSVVVRNAYSAISSGTERTRFTAAQKSMIARAKERPDLVREIVRRASSEGIRKTRSSVHRKLGEEVAVGYSSAGHIARIGSAVRGLAPGDRVACAGAGFANHAELVCVPANLCARVPQNLSLEEASLTTIAAIALHGIRLANVQIGERVAVIGCGLVGQIACRLLQGSGAEVFAIDIDSGRVDDAVAAGADRGFSTGDRVLERIFEAAPQGLDAVLVTAAAASNDPLLLAANIARDRGALVLVGDVPVELPRAPLYQKELSFRISRSYGPGRYDLEYEERGLDYPVGYVRWTEQRNMECVLDLQARSLLDLRTLIADIVPVDDAAQAFSRLSGDESQAPRGALLLSYPSSPEEDPTPRAKTARKRPGRARSGGDAPRIGLIGPGGFATNVLVPAFVEAGARLELVGGGSGPSAEAAVRTLGFARVAADELDVIGDPDVDAIVVATRHGSHANLAARALAAGKHVFCEKPLALKEDELAHVLQAARESGRVLLVGFNRRFSPLLRDMRSFVGDSAIVANYRISAGRVPPSSWVNDLEQGGGRILGELCHFVDALVYLADARIRMVAAAAVDEPSLPVQARDNVVVSVTLDDGSIGTIVYVAAGSAAVPKERIEVFASARTAILDDYKRLELYAEGRKGKEVSRRQDKGHYVEVQAFLHAIAAGTTPVALDEIENVSLASLAIVESLRNGAAVRVNTVG
jgi:predicted dehydrogenase/threonine dehydrogenase-like Zn-dependent dehydrogenase